MKNIFKNSLLILFSSLMICGSAWGLTTVSFEDGDTGWDVIGFQRVSIFSDKSGTQYLPSDGAWMMSVSNAYGAVFLDFSSTDTSLLLSVDINLIDPMYSVFPERTGNNMGDLSAMVFWASLYDSSGRMLMSDILSSPVKANNWETVTMSLPNLTIGEKYKLEIETGPNNIACIQVVGADCPRAMVRGTVLLDNIRLTDSSENNLNGSMHMPNPGDCNGKDMSCGPPDLVMSEVSDPPASMKCGGSFRVKDTVTNQASKMKGRSVTRYYLSIDMTKDDSDILLKGKRSVPKMKAGKNSKGTSRVTVPGTTPPGNYYVIACSDDTNKITESDEDNNCLSSNAMIEVKEKTSGRGVK